MQNNNSPHIFISHATADDAFVRELRIKLELHGLKSGWTCMISIRPINNYEVFPCVNTNPVKASRDIMLRSHHRLVSVGVVS